MSKAMKITVIVVALAVVGCGAVALVAALGSKDLQSIGAPVTTTAAGTGSAATTAVKKPAPGINEDGTHLVPNEVKPGTYRATVPADSVGCYWARLKSPSNADIIENGLGDPGDKMTVTIKATDKAFETNNCGRWVKV